MEAKLPLRVVKYVQNRLVKIPGIEYKDKDLLGIAEVWHEGADLFEEVMAWRATDEAKHLVDDENSFLDMSRVTIYAVEENIVV